MVIVELLEEATRDQKTADPPSPRLRRASWRPPLLAAVRLAAEEQQALPTLRQALFALPACPP